MVQAITMEILESLPFDVEGTVRLDEPEVRALLRPTKTGATVMQTFIDRYSEQGQPEMWQESRLDEMAADLLRPFERNFGRPGEAVRSRIIGAAPETPLRRTNSNLTWSVWVRCCTDSVPRRHSACADRPLGRS
jgi:hypothetical protein